MEIYTRVVGCARWMIDTIDFVSILCIIVIGVIGAFFRKISSSSTTKHQCTTTKAKSSLKSSPQQGKRLGSVTFAEGTKFDEIIHEEESVRSHVRAQLISPWCLIHSYKISQLLTPFYTLE